MLSWLFKVDRNTLGGICCRVIIVGSNFTISEAINFIDRNKVSICRKEAVLAKELLHCT